MRSARLGSSPGRQREDTLIRPTTHKLQCLRHSKFSPSGKRANMCEYSMLVQDMINNNMLAWELAECSCMPY